MTLRIPIVVCGHSTVLRLLIGSGRLPLLVERAPLPKPSTWCRQQKQKKQMLTSRCCDQGRNICQTTLFSSASSLTSAIPCRLVHLPMRLFSTLKPNQDDSTDTNDLHVEASFDDKVIEDDLFSVAAAATATTTTTTTASAAHEKAEQQQQQQKQQELGPNPGLVSIVEQGLPSLEKVAVHLQYQTRRVQSIPIATITSNNFHSTAVPTSRRPTLQRRPTNEEDDNNNNNEDDDLAKSSSRLLPPPEMTSSSYDAQAPPLPPQHLVDPRQHAEARRILDTANDCLEELAMRQPQRARRAGLVLWGGGGNSGGGGGGINDHEDGGGEPIVLLECVVNRNVRQAKLYWTLPYTLLLDERLTNRKYRHLVERIQNDLIHGVGGGGRGRQAGGGGGSSSGAKVLARQVHAKLSSYYPPRIKLVPATDEMVQQVMEEFSVG